MIYMSNGRRPLAGVTDGPGVTLASCRLDGPRMAEAEASRILAETEPAPGVAWRITGRGWACEPGTREALYAVRDALADALAAAVADGGLLDSLAGGAR